MTGESSFLFKRSLDAASVVSLVWDALVLRRPIIHSSCGTLMVLQEQFKSIKSLLLSNHSRGACRSVCTAPLHLEQACWLYGSTLQRWWLSGTYIESCQFIGWWCHQSHKRTHPDHHSSLWRQFICLWFMRDFAVLFGYFGLFGYLDIALNCKESLGGASLTCLFKTFRRELVLWMTKHFAFLISHSMVVVPLFKQPQLCGYTHFRWQLFDWAF